MCAHPRATRTAAYPRRCHQSTRPHARAAKSPRASLPLLRRRHAHHRDLPARPTAQLPRVADATADQDRYLMTPELRTNRRNDRHLARRSASAAACVSRRTLCAMIIQKHFAAPHTVPVARQNPDPDAFRLGKIESAADTPRHLRGRARGKIPIARGTATPDLTPRFRALALFRRRPPQRLDRPSSRRPNTCTEAVITKVIRSRRRRWRGRQAER